MSKKLTLTYKDKTYTLEYTRRSLREMESRGFVVDELETKPATMIPLLFSGAFLAHHRNVKQDLINEIWDSIRKKMSLIETLGGLYSEPLNELLEDAEDEDEGDEGNAASWSVVN